MSFFNAIDTSASALTAERLRMDVISENLANVNTTRTAEGGPYKRNVVLFQERDKATMFEKYYSKALARAGVSSPPGYAGHGVRVSKIVKDERKGPLVYDPTHPDADAEGYVTQSNVNVVEEMVNLIASSRSYEANVTSMNITKTMLAKTLELTQR